MGYLDNTSVTVDAILTKRGREVLATGRTNFEITKFALGDDEIDYTLWNPSHTQGTSYYGEMIENMPVMEAITDENYALKYRLLTLPKTTINLPTITVSPGSISIPQKSLFPPGSSGRVTITIAGGITETYTVTLLDDTLGNISARTVAGVTGNSFVFEPVQQLTPNQDQSTTIIVVGNTSGARVDINVTVTATISANNTVATSVRNP